MDANCFYWRTGRSEVEGCGDKSLCDSIELLSHLSGVVSRDLVALVPEQLSTEGEAGDESVMLPSSDTEVLGSLSDIR